MPDLRRSCRLEALAITHGLSGFAESSAAVMTHARSRGATHLPSGLVDELIDWIDTTILRTIAEIEQRPTVADEIMDETVRAMEAAGCQV